MFSKNAWDQESARYYITTVTVGDTELEVYGEVVGPESDIIVNVITMKVQLLNVYRRQR